MKKLIILLLITFSGYFAYNQTWDVPTKYKTIKSTIDLKDVNVIKDGKQLWAKYCKSCHGTEGLGDGPRSAMLKTPSGDFSSVKFQSQTDGEIFYKTVFGFGEMPNYEKKIPNIDDQWSLVGYMRTLKK